jgi:predicted nucleic acid-binding protein
MNDESIETRVVVDASVWVASLVPQDVFFPPSQKWLQVQHVQGVKLLAPVLLLTEVAGVISRQTRSPFLALKAVQTLEKLPGLTLVGMNYSLVQLATELAARLGLRGADAYYVAVAAFLGLPLATFDQDQSSRSQTVVPGIIVPA